MIAEAIAGWTEKALAVCGIARNEEGRWGFRPANLVEKQRLESLVRESADEQLRAWQAAGVRVALTLRSDGWEEMLREHEEEDKRLLEFFVDPECDTWDKHVWNVGRVRQHRDRLRVMGYGQVGLGYLAEKELAGREANSRGRARRAAATPK